jgi:hypothetical protein
VESHEMVLSGSRVYVSRKSGDRAVECVKMTGLFDSELDCGGSGEVDSLCLRRHSLMGQGCQCVVFSRMSQYWGKCVRVLCW